MKTLEEVLEMQEVRINHATLETYIRRQWVRPLKNKSGWVFEDIDVARLQLVCHLEQDIEVNEQGMDVVLSLLDQLYGLRAYMKNLSAAITRQPEQVRAEILRHLQEEVNSD